MRSKYFISGSFVGAFLIAGGILAFNYYVDYFGVFGSALGRKIEIYSHERVSKVLLMRNYVPSNFNALLLGASGADSLDTGQFKSFKVYNGSVLAADYSELADISEGALATGQFRLLLLSVRLHLFLKTPAKKPRLPEGREIFLTALWSEALLANYLGWMDNALFGTAAENDDTGDWQRKKVANASGLEDYRKRGERVKAEEEAAMPIPIDEKFTTDLEFLIKKSREMGTKILAFYSPMPMPAFRSNQHRIEEARKKIFGLFGNEEPVIDFNTGCVSHIAEDLDNFTDFDYLTDRGGARVVKYLDQAAGQLARGEEIHLACDDSPLRDITGH